jgi:hypothetical protein
MKSKTSNYLKNLFGFCTNRKIVVLSFDDYCNVRVDSKKALVNLNNAGIKTANRFDAFDSLETKEDLEMLFDALTTVYDKNMHNAIITAFSLPVNINFERMRNEDYKKYHYELIPQTYEKLSCINTYEYEGAWALWKDGMDKNLIHPEFHGREHFNLKIFNEKLNVNDTELLIALQNRSLLSISNTGYKSINFTGAFKFWQFQENDELQKVITSGLDAFESVFGFRASQFNAPGGPEHSILHKTLSENGIKFIDEPMFKNEHQGEGKYKTKFYYTGKKNIYDQLFQVRNCVFEPTFDGGFSWVNFTFNQIEAAFRLKKPAIISSHRVNFSGNIDPRNRSIGISSLKGLLKKIVSKYPDVEFLSSNELGKVIYEK